MGDEVKVGQVWKDRDWRTYGKRFVRVIRLDPTHALAQRCDDKGQSVTHKVTRIVLKRFKPTSTGYDLQGDDR